jgi:hypothetical protein
MDAEHPDPSATLFLKRYARELALLASGLDELQNTVGELASLTTDSDLSMRAQAADMLAQHARVLSDVADKLAAENQFDSHSVERALRGVTLTGVARRLAGVRSVAPETGGEIELF